MSRHTLAVLVVLAACHVLIARVPSRGSSPPLEPRARAEIESQWRLATEHPVLDGLVIRWRTQDFFVPPDEQVEAMRQQVEKDAAHPIARELQEYERRIAEGTGLTRHFSFRCRDADEWRLCQGAGEQGGEVAFVDYVLTKRTAWKLTPTWAVLIDPTKPLPQGHPIRDVGAFFMHDLFMLVDGGLRDSVLLGASLTQITAQTRDAPDTDRPDDAAEWWSDASDPDGKIGRRFRWKWAPVADRAFVVEMLVTRGYDEGARWVFDGWRAVPESFLSDARSDLGSEGASTTPAPHSRWLAARAEKYGASGKLERRVLLDEVTREPPERFDDVVREPWFDSPDALRGELRYRSITDFRGETPYEIVKTSRGIERTPLALVQQVSERGERDYRRLGWGLAGLTVVGLVCVRLHRGRGAAGLSSTHSKEKLP